MTDQTLSHLNNLENHIYELGTKIHTLLEEINRYLQGEKTRDLNESNFNLDDILKTLSYVRDELHRQIDDIYKDNNFQHLPKSFGDMIEKINMLKELRNDLNNR
jgi:hypothetical protein